METQMKWGAMYARLEGKEAVQAEPIQLGDHLIKPGDRISRIGKKKRSMVEMKDGFYMVYQGRVNDIILFTSEPTGCDGKPWYYAFIYVDSTTLLMCHRNSCCDVKVDDLLLC